MLRLRKMLNQGFIKAPQWLELLQPGPLWHYRKPNKLSSEPTVFLTFDDGPTTGVTEKVLDILASYQATATFFVIGESVEKDVKLVKAVAQQGHTIANHTWSHSNGWNANINSWLKEIDRCAAVIKDVTNQSSQFFRPPYGRLPFRFWRRKMVGSPEQRIVMWDVTSGDFIPELSWRDIVERTIDSTENGSIVLFHDSQLASPRLLKALPLILENLSSRGFQFSPLH
jgi:peptidoglycan-N-acetylglucosamine deacetylase